MRRKLITTVLCLLLAFCITACSDETGDTEAKKGSTTLKAAEERDTSSKSRETTKKTETATTAVEETDTELSEETNKEDTSNTETGRIETNGTQKQTQSTQPESTKTSGTSKNNGGGSSSKTSQNTTNNSNNNNNTNNSNTNNDNDNYKILNNYETLGSRYDKYKNAYKTGNTSGLSGDELTFFKNLKECLDHADSKGAKIDKEKAVHDWIILHCKYDEKNYYADTVPWSSYNPEGVFINGTAVCNGYALAFQLCMEILGIESKIVVGTASYNYHAWNIVKMDDGCWYHVDVTWDDPIPDREGRINYRYFNITDSYMRGYGQHNFNINEVCNATQYGYWNYYESDTLYVETCDQLYEGIINWINSGKYTGRVAMEYGSVDFDYFNNMYDYIRVYNATHKEVSYKFKMIYEDNGKTTHFPNGCAYADFVVFDGSADEEDDEEVIKYISSHDEFESVIKEYSAGKNAVRTLNIYFDPVLLGSGDYSETFVKSVAVKALQWMNKQCLEGNETYHISMCFDYHDEVFISIEQVLTRIDELYNAGVPGEYEIVYYTGLSGDNELAIGNALQKHMSSKYNISGHGNQADPVMWSFDRDYCLESTYVIILTVTGK